MELCYSPLIAGGHLVDSDTQKTVYLAMRHVEALQGMTGPIRAAYILEYVFPTAPTDDKALLAQWLKDPVFFADCLADVEF